MPSQVALVGTFFHSFLLKIYWDFWRKFLHRSFYSGRQGGLIFLCFFEDEFMDKRLTELRTYVSPHGLLLTAQTATTHDVFLTRWRESQFDLFDEDKIELVTRLPLQLSGSPKTLNALTKIYEGLNWKVFYPARKGQICARDFETGELLGTGTCHTLRKLLGIDGRAVWRSQWCGFPQKRANGRWVWFHPSELLDREA